MIKICTFAALFAITFTGFAEEIEESQTQNLNIANIDNAIQEVPMKHPSWAVMIGQSDYGSTNPSNYDIKKSGGLLLGFEKYFTDGIGVGFNYANFKVERPGKFEQSPTVETIQTSFLYFNITPIVYQIGKAKLSGSIEAGWASTQTLFAEDKYGPFVGASFEANFKNQLGLRLDTKTVIETSQLTNSISVLGYY